MTSVTWSNGVPSLLKFWVDVSPETQLERFEAREANPEKRWKITAEDWA